MAGWVSATHVCAYLGARTSAHPSGTPPGRAGAPDG